MNDFDFLPDNSLDVGRAWADAAGAATAVLPEPGPSQPFGRWTGEVPYVAGVSYMEGHVRGDRVSLDANGFVDGNTFMPPETMSFSESVGSGTHYLKEKLKTQGWSVECCGSCVSGGSCNDEIAEPQFTGNRAGGRPETATGQAGGGRFSRASGGQSGWTCPPRVRSFDHVSRCTVRFDMKTRHMDYSCSPKCETVAFNCPSQWGGNCWWIGELLVISYDDISNWSIISMSCGGHICTVDANIKIGCQQTCLYAPRTRQQPTVPVGGVGGESSVNPSDCDLGCRESLVKERVDECEVTYGVLQGRIVPKPGALEKCWMEMKGKCQKGEGCPKFSPQDETCNFLKSSSGIFLARIGYWPPMVKSTCVRNCKGKFHFKYRCELDCCWRRIPGLGATRADPSGGR
jgi:hypothetical protein